MRGAVGARRSAAGGEMTTLRSKIVAVAVLPTVLLVAVLLVVFAVQRRRLSGEVEAGMARLAEENLARAARDLRTLCEATHRELSSQVPRSLRVAHEELDRIGAPSLAPERVRWRARNQLDGSVAEVDLPRLLLGGRWSGQDPDPGKRALLVDRVRELVGADVTLFQRMDDAGAMLRVATTVRRPDGLRAIGTFIPVREPDGTPNRVVSTVLEGRTYEGRARVLDAWYLATYEPLRDRAGRIVGMLFVGLRQDALEGIRSGVAASRIGTTGALYVLGANGNQRGRYVIAPQGLRDGEDAWEQRDARGVLWIQELVAAATRAGGEPVRSVHVVSSGGGRTRARVAQVTYFEPWDWVIVAEMDEAEAVAPFRVIERALATAIATVVAIAALLLLVTFAVARAAARRITAPLEAMATAAERIALGDVQQDVAYRSADEVGRLAEAFRGTIGYTKQAARGAAALARGDLSTALVARSAEDELTTGLQSAQSELRRVLEELHRLTVASVEGRLYKRAASEGFSGAYRRTLDDVNSMLDTLVGHLDAMPAPAMIVGPDGEIRFTNQTAASLLGRSQEDLVGTRCEDSFRTDDCGTSRCACMRAMAEGREVSSVTVAHPEGLDLEIVYSAVPLHDAEGKVVGALQVVSDQRAVKCGPRRSTGG